MDARETALLALNACERQGGWSDGALKKQISAAGLDSRDAALATQLCFGVLQNQLLLDFYLSSFSNIPLKRMEGRVVQALRLGAYQMLFLDRIPHSAAVNRSVELTRAYCKNPRAAGMVNGILRSLERSLERLPTIPQRDPVEYLSILYSHPAWMVREFLLTLGNDGAAALLRANNAQPATAAQVNTLKINARELRHLQLVLDKLKGEEVPVIFTVFTPITIADKVCGGKLLSYIREGHGEDVKAALEVITETTAQLVAAAIDMGADGIFLASQMSSYDKCTDRQYLEYGKPYDLRVLEAAGKGWMNTIHCHGDHIMFHILKDYPVQVFNWHAWESLPALDEAYALTGKCLMGGLSRTDITQQNRGAIQNQIFQCFKLLGGRHQILTPGCVIRYPLDDDMLSFIGTTRNEIEAVFDQR